MEAFFQQWKLAFRNLRRNSRRNLVSGLAISFGFSGLALMGSYIHRTDIYLATNAIYTNDAGHVSVFRAGGQEKFLREPTRYLLTGEDQRKISSLLNTFSEVEFTAKFLHGQGILSTGCVEVPFLATGVEDAVASRIRVHPEVRAWCPGIIAPPFEKGLGDYPQVPEGISVTPQIALMAGKPKTWEEAGPGIAPVVADCSDKALKASLGQTADVQLVARAFSGDFSAVDSFIVARHSTGLEFAEETSVRMGLSLAQKLFQTDGVTYLAVFLRPGTDVRNFLDRFGTVLRPLGDYELFPYYHEKVGTFYNGVMGFLRTMAGFFFILVMATVAITVVNFLTVGFLERQREIGTLRAIGYTPERIARMFFRESLALVLLGLCGGVVISAVVVAAVNEAAIPFSPPGIAGKMPFMLRLTPAICGLVSGIVGGTAIIAAWIKLKGITRTAIVDLLKG